MMRRPMTTLILVITCVMLVLGAGLAVVIVASAGVGTRRSDAAPVGRDWPLTMSAAPGDLTLAEVSFRPGIRGQPAAARPLQVAVGTPFGDDYLAAAAVRSPTSRVLRVLVLLVNRPSPLLDPASVSVRLTAPRALGVPLLLTSADPLARPVGAHMPAMCNLALPSSGLSASSLRILRSRGQALAGFGAAGALAQAYDLVCGLPYKSSFTQAVARSPSASTPTPPESTSPAPSPTPPAGKIPGEGCIPTPGYACPAAFKSTARTAAVEG
jgi:hypothetical protein